ncbi:MAG: extracellular solute-binding protein, partial [Oscillospiraceae bacterium]|nr:extracellular solute-binding protein [Oscillospiraceae bacterium]
YNGVQQEKFDNAVIEFNETIGREQGILVEAYSKGSISELSDAVLASLREDVGAEPSPNMFTAYAETAYAADKLGSIVDLSQYFAEDELAEYVDGYIEEGRFSTDSGLKIFPTAKSTEIMILNATDWQKFADAEQVSTDDLTTWESVVQVAEKYYAYTDALTPDVPNDGKAFFGRDSVANYMIIGAKQLGLEFVTEEGSSFQLHLDENIIRKLWENYYVPYVKGYYTAQSRYRSDDAKIGEIIALIGSTTGSAYFPDSVTIDDDYSYPIDALVLPVPNFEGTESYVVQQGAGMVITEADEKIEYACTVFLKWFTEKERNITFSVASGYMPVKKEANTAEALASFSQLNEDDNNGMLVQSMNTAIDEINNYHLYTTKPFDNSSLTRDFLGDYIQNTAASVHEEANTRIQNGEDRTAVLQEYTSDEAFAVWYAGFSSGLRSATGLS